MYVTCYMVYSFIHTHVCVCIYICIYVHYMVLLTFRTNGSSYHSKEILDSVRPVRLDSFLGDLFHPGPLVLLRQGGGLLYFVCLLAERALEVCVHAEAAPSPAARGPVAWWEGGGL